MLLILGIYFFPSLSMMARLTTLLFRLARRLRSSVKRRRLSLCNAELKDDGEGKRVEVADSEKKCGLGHSLRETNYTIRSAYKLLLDERVNNEQRTEALDRGNTK
jgi:hypothetical protein